MLREIVEKAKPLKYEDWLIDDISKDLQVGAVGMFANDIYGYKRFLKREYQRYLDSF